MAAHCSFLGQSVLHRTEVMAAVGPCYRASTQLQESQLMALRYLFRKQRASRYIVLQKGSCAWRWSLNIGRMWGDY